MSGYCPRRARRLCWRGGALSFCRRCRMLVVYGLVFAFVVGAAVGSFVNVCVARLPYERSLIWPGSRCLSCCQPVRLYDNVPLVSYWVLRGRCRSCGARFSARYFLVELFCGLA